MTDKTIIQLCAICASGALIACGVHHFLPPQEAPVTETPKPAPPKPPEFQPFEVHELLASS